MVIAALGLAACSDSDPDLDAARTRWRAAAGDSASYRMDWQESCFGGCLSRGARVFVVNGGIMSASYRDTGEPLTGDDRPRIKTVDELFDWIADVRGDVDRLTVTYDGTLGYPLSIVEDPNSDHTDDELGIQISGVVLGVP